MKKLGQMKVHAAVVAVVVALGASPAMAQFGALLSKVAFSGGSASDPDAFVKAALVAEKLMNNSVTLLGRSLLSKQQVADLDAQRKAASTVTDAADKQAKENEVLRTEVAMLNEKMSSQKFQDDIKKMDAKQKEDLGSAAFNFALALLQDKALVEQSGTLISGVSTNPMYLTKLVTLKDVASSLTNQVTAASAIASKMPDIFSAVGVKAPTSKDEKPKVTAQTSDE